MDAPQFMIVLKFIAEHYGGNLATMVFIGIIVWKARGKFATWQIAQNTKDMAAITAQTLMQEGQNEMQGDINDIKTERKELLTKNDAEHREFYERIGLSEIQIARIKVKVGINGNAA